MSDLPADYRDQLDLRAIIAQIDRDRAEGQKFAAEQGKLLAEGYKFNRDKWILPLSVIGAVLAAIIARLPEILHAAGVGR